MTPASLMGQGILRCEDHNDQGCDATECEPWYNITSASALPGKATTNATTVAVVGASSPGVVQVTRTDSSKAIILGQSGRPISLQQGPGSTSSIGLHRSRC